VTTPKAKNVKQVLRKYGYKSDAFKKVHDFAYKAVDDEKLSLAQRKEAARILISLAKELIDMERKLAAKPSGRRITKQRVADRDKIRASEVVKRGTPLQKLKVLI
jgi:hypothetical protein